MLLQASSQGGLWSQWMLLMLSVAGMGLLGILMVTLLLTTWRRHNARISRRLPGEPKVVPPDLWQIAGERLQATDDDGDEDDEYDEPAEDEDEPDDDERDDKPGRG